jgi:hypothetical protein
MFANLFSARSPQRIAGNMRAPSKLLWPPALNASNAF